MAKKKDKCVFNESWLTDKRFSPWLKRSRKQRAYCSFCSKDFDISDMGCSALTSHASGKKHSEISGLKSLKCWKYFPHKFEQFKNKQKTNKQPANS